MAYLINLRPYKSELQQVICTTDEFLIIFGIVVLYFLYYFQNDLKKVNIIGWIIFSLVLFTLYKSVMVVIYTVIIKFYQRFKRWLRVKLNYKMWEHKNMKILQKRKRQKLRDKRLRESIGKKNNYNSIFTNLFRIL